jgi:hypothetical protein
VPNEEEEEEEEEYQIKQIFHYRLLFPCVGDVLN